MSEMQQTQVGQIQIPGVDTVGNLPAGSIQRLLAANLGKEVVAEFVVGMDVVERKAGTLYAVNTDYLVLFDDVNLVDIACDIYSLKFITFYLPGTRPDLAQGNGGSSVNNDAPTQGTMGAYAVSAAAMAARPRGQAALNYAKRKTRKLE